MVLPAEEILVTRSRRTIVTEDSEEEEIVWGERGRGDVRPSGGGKGEGVQGDDSGDSTESDRVEGAISARDKIRLDRLAAKLELSKVGVYLSVARVGLTFKSDPGEGIMASRSQIRLGIELPLQRLVKEVLNLWEVAPVQMYDNFYEMMRDIEGINAKLTGEGRGLIKWFDIITFYSKKASQNSGLKNLSWSNPRNYIDNLLEASEDWVPTKTEMGKGHIAPEAPKVVQSKVSQRKRCRTVGKDDAVVAKQASMDDPDEAAKEIKRHMFQQMEAWVRSFKKAMMSAKGKLRQAVESLDLSRGTEASLLSKVKKLKQDLEFINDKGYDPDTLELYPISPKLVEGGDLEMKEADVVDEVAGSTGGGVKTFVIGVASGGTGGGMVGEGTKPSTKSVVGVGAGGPVEEEGVTVPI
ncbi:hypothetical protein GIB67_000018 [Kingdonia uniflora]|uniref:Uncharacterized protein n=1 Tax=Kingdonia uniflora TaxID=39325 RepID=A0A7J7MNT6_9MAGN|nr:hypothetical protein GIB67_000018 [Kingdonia uniflora]